MTDSLIKLRERLAQIEDLGATAELLGWDQNTKMPANGAATRAHMQATLARIQHERFTAAETGRLLEGAANELARRGSGAEIADSDDARIVENVRRDWEKARRTPEDLAAELAHAASAGQEAWVAARAAGDFAAFAPHLQRNLDLARRYVECHLGHEDYACAYDVLLDDYDPGMRTAEVEALLAELKAALIPLIATVTAAGFEQQVTNRQFPVVAQRGLVMEVLERIGFDPAGWRLDDTIHPFATAIGAGDIRVTTRYEEAHFPTALYGAMHETGHGLYSAQIPAELGRTPIGEARSLSLHESQSRLWENLVGRSRAFCEWLAPRVASYGGAELANLDARSLFRAVNRVSPSLIRIEADEATYGLHIVLRFELEQELIEGRLRVHELPDAWNARMREYLGVEVPNDAEGVLQDVHWSAGLIGYFPTYALGNLISAQLWRAMSRDIPDLDERLRTAEFGPLRQWLREHVHRYGSKFNTREVLTRAVGGPLEVSPYVDYLKAKLGDVYGLDLA